MLSRLRHSLCVLVCPALYCLSGCGTACVYLCALLFIVKQVVAQILCDLLFIVKQVVAQILCTRVPFYLLLSRLWNSVCILVYPSLYC
jgi:hypothetical protein